MLSVSECPLLRCHRREPQKEQNACSAGVAGAGGADSGAAGAGGAGAGGAGLGSGVVTGGANPRVNEARIERRCKHDGQQERREPQPELPSPALGDH